MEERVKRLEEDGKAREERWREVMATHHRAWKQALVEEKTRGRRELMAEKERGKRELREAENRWGKKLERVMEEMRGQRAGRGVSREAARPGNWGVARALGREALPPHPDGCYKPIDYPNPRTGTTSPIRPPVLPSSRPFFPPLPTFPLQKDLSAPLPSLSPILPLMPPQARVEREGLC